MRRKQNALSAKCKYCGGGIVLSATGDHWIHTMGTVMCQVYDVEDNKLIYYKATPDSESVRIG